MKHNLSRKTLTEAISHFNYPGKLIRIEQNTNGHINDTFFLTFATQNGLEHYSFQRINTSVFLNPKDVMENELKVTAAIRERFLARGKDPSRRTIHLVMAKDGRCYYIDPQGNFFRSYRMITGASSYDVADAAMFEEAARAFGKFQRDLANFDASTLVETIPNFHNTELRYKALMKSIEEDAVGRVKECKDEIAFAKERKELASEFNRAIAEKIVPLRVTHNDTKLNNVLFDDETGKAIAVIDLDTVMPGLAMNDFGDAIRFGANTAAEDETDLSKVHLDLSLFASFAKGFLEGTNHKLTKEEVLLFPKGAMMMTYECGMRFLKDYLDGDVYFHIDHDSHNLERARCQFALLASMEEHYEEMMQIIREQIEKE